MASKHKPLSFTPKDGGVLLGRHSHEVAGFPNYVIKRDFRRDFDAEIRAEGYVPFQTNFDSVGDQPYPQRQGDDETFNAITLIHQARRPNGATAVIAGTESTIYRHYASGEDGYYEASDSGPYYEVDYVVSDYYVEDGDPLYYVPDYYKDEDGSWVVIGSGFSEDAARWEALNINGWAVFNNGMDLPVTYRVEHGEVRPNYELREAGIVRVGTIAEYNGILVCNDIYTFKEGELAEFMAHTDSGSATLRQHGAYLSQPFTAEKSSGGYAIRGTGATGFVTVPNDATLQTYTNGITVEAWIRVSESNSLSYIINKGSSPGGCFRMKVEGGILTCTIERAGNSQHSATLDWDFGSDWINVTFTYDPGTCVLKIYINGVLATTNVGALAPPQAMFSNTTDIRIADADSGTHTIDVAELRLWTKVRSASEILDNLSSPLTPDADLVGYWMFDDGTGSTATDSSGNGNDGTVGVGASWIASEAPPDSYIEITAVAAATNGLTRSGGTATYVSAIPHKFSTGQLVKVSGAAGTEYNGLFTVTVTDPLTFTYSVSGTPVSPDAGTPEVQRAIFGDATFNYDAIIGKQIFLLNGFKAEIVDVLDAVKVRVDKSVSSLSTAALFQIINSTTETALSGTVAKNGTTTVTGTSTAFRTQLWPGASILVPGSGTGNEIRIVAAIASDTSLTVTDAFTGTASGQTGKVMSDYLVIADSDYFTSAMEGKYLFFDNLQYRLIEDYINVRWVAVDTCLSVAEQQYKLENTNAYSNVTDASSYERIQYARAWSGLNEPLRFAASVPCSISAGSRLLELEYQARSIEPGDELIVVGAGVAGGNLTASVVWVHPNHTTLYLDEAASTTVDSDTGLVARSDAAGSVAGSDDLQDDGSAIIKAMELSGVLVTYKDTAIFVTRYTGNAADPFSNERIYKDDGMRALFYRNTLSKVGQKSHVYGGRDEFYEFNLVNREPVIFKPFVGAMDVFYDEADLADTNLIFAAQNMLTQEVFFCFPSSTSDKALIYDVKWGTQRTTSAEYTAMATVKKPEAGAATGVQQDWCLMGLSNGSVMRYGRASIPQTEWGGREAVYSRDGSGYESRLKSGLIGDRFFETTISEGMAELATQDYPTVTTFTYNLYGWRNAAEQPPRTLVSKSITFPNQSPLVPMYFQAHYFQDEVVATGVNNPLRLIARSVTLDRVFSRGQRKAGQQP